MSGKYQDTGMCDRMYNHPDEYSNNPGVTIRDDCTNFAKKCKSGIEKNFYYCLSKKAKEHGQDLCATYFETKGDDQPLVDIRQINTTRPYIDIVEGDQKKGCSTKYENWGQWRFRRLDKNKYKKIGKKSTPRRSTGKPPSKSKRRLTRKSPSRSKRLSNRKSPTKKSPRKSGRSTRKR
jgi:hypothetical protein